MVAERSNAMSTDDERKILPFRKRKENQNDMEKSHSEKKEYSIKGIIIGIVVAVVTEVMGTIIIACTIDPVKKLLALPGMVSEVQEKVERIQGSLDEVTKEGGKLTKMNEEIGELAVRVAKAEGMLEASLAIKINVKEEVFESIKGIYKFGESDAENVLEKLPTFGTNMETGDECEPRECIGKKLLIPYIDGEQEVIFYGQYNDKYHWNGDCVINVYENGNLVFIMNASYNDGALGEYCQIFPDEVDLDKPDSDGIEHKKVWIVSHRNRVEEVDVTGKKSVYNEGETLYYTREKERYEQKFKFEEVTGNDVVNANNFETSIELSGAKVERYYNGRTSNGMFNDETGNAYLVKYDENEDVKYLYRGKMVEGKEHDENGGSWFIGIGKDGENYYYYDGKFEHGHHAPITWPPLTQEEIDNLINPADYKCSLKGLVSELV